MPDPILAEVEAFMKDTGLGVHRTGMLLARNGRLVQRLRADRRFWPETIDLIRTAIAYERKKRRMLTEPEDPEQMA